MLFPNAPGIRMLRMRNGPSHSRLFANSRLIRNRSVLDWAAALPPSSPARNFHCQLIFFLTKTPDYPDSKIVFDLAHGVPIAGPIAATPCLPARKRNAQIPYRQWKANIPRRNRDIVNRVRKTQGAELALHVSDGGNADRGPSRAGRGSN